MRGQGNTFPIEKLQQYLPANGLHGRTLNLGPGEDTLVIIAPSYLASAKATDCGGGRISGVFMTVSKKSLLGTGSQVFIKMFESSSQNRLRNRHHLSLLPHGIKYVIDLTPSDDGDDIGPQVAQLSLTRGLVEYPIYAASKNVPEQFVLGHDDSCDCGLLRANLLNGKDVDTDYAEYTGKTFNEYCPVRHFMAIIHLLLALKGMDITLDSAPRVWTITGVANILECTSVIRDEVFKWMVAENNMVFLERLPEEALMIAYRLKLYNVFRATFAILANELAHDMLSSNLAAAGVPEHTALGRKRSMDVLADDVQTMLEHAGRDWADMVLLALKNLRAKNGAVFENLGVGEWMTLKHSLNIIKSHPEGFGGYTQKELTEMYTNIMEALCELWEKEFQSAFDEPHVGLFCDIMYSGPRDRCEIWDNVLQFFSPEQKILYPGTWLRLRNDFRPVDTFTTVPPPWVYDHPIPGKTQNLGTVCTNFTSAMSLVTNSAYTYPFMLSRFYNDWASCVIACCSGWTESADDLLTTMDISKIMCTNLSAQIWKLIPIWADGNDDGSGGVFESAIPEAEMGPIGPGPAFHTGYTQDSEASEFAPSTTTIAPSTHESDNEVVDGISSLPVSSKDACFAKTEVDVVELRMQHHAPSKSDISDVSFLSSSSMNRLVDRMQNLDTEQRSIIESRAATSEADSYFGDPLNPIAYVDDPEDFEFYMQDFSDDEFDADYFEDNETEKGSVSDPDVVDMDLDDNAQMSDGEPNIDVVSVSSASGSSAVLNDESGNARYDAASTDDGEWDVITSVSD